MSLFSEIRKSSKQQGDTIKEEKRPTFRGICSCACGNRLYTRELKHRPREWFTLVNEEPFEFRDDPLEHCPSCEKELTLVTCTNFICKFDSGPPPTQE